MDPSYKRLMSNLLRCPGGQDWWNIHHTYDEMDTCENDLAPPVQHNEPFVPPDSSYAAADETNQQSSQAGMDPRNSELETPISDNFSNMAVGKTSQLNPQVKKNLRISEMESSLSGDLSTMAVGDTSQQNTQVKKKRRNSQMESPKSGDLSTVGETSQVNSQVIKNLGNSVFKIPKSVASSEIEIKDASTQVRERRRISKLESKKYSSKRNKQNLQVKKSPIVSAISKNPITHEIKVDMGDYKAKEIAVHLDGDLLVVHGERKRNPQEPDLIFKQITHMELIPDFVDYSKITSFVVEDGMVKLVGPKKFNLEDE